MAEKNQNVVVRAFTGLFEKAVDEGRGAILLLLLPVAAAVLTALTDWMKDYAPFSWAVAGVTTFLVTTVALALYSVYRKNVALTKFEEGRSEALQVNPQLGSFSNTRIRLTDFFHPFHVPIRNARFVSCELFGPAIILLDGCILTDTGQFRDCDIVIVKDGETMFTATHFRSCAFIGCNFYQTILLMTQKNFDEFKATYKGVNPVTAVTYEKPKA